MYSQKKLMLSWILLIESSDLIKMYNGIYKSFEEEVLLS